MISSSLTHHQNKELVNVSPGSYYKLSESGRKMIVKSSRGLVICSFFSETTGNPISNIMLIEGELLLVPIQTEQHV